MHSLEPRARPVSDVFRQFAIVGQPTRLLLAELGMPAVNYGPGDPEVAHSRGEHVPVAQIAEVESRLRTWLTS